jgi:hypothetical protein
MRKRVKALQLNPYPFGVPYKKEFLEDGDTKPLKALFILLCELSNFSLF